MREGARMLRALAQKLQCASERLAMLRENFEILELKPILEIFLCPSSFAFVVNTDERARSNLVLSDIEMVSATAFVRMKDEYPLSK